MFYTLKIHPHRNLENNVKYSRKTKERFGDVPFLQIEKHSYSLYNKIKLTLLSSTQFLSSPTFCILSWIIC